MKYENQIKNYLEKKSSKLISINDGLLSQGIIDSLGLIELVAFIEESFDVTFKSDDLNIENFESIKKLCVHIKKIDNGKSKL